MSYHKNMIRFVGVITIIIGTLSLKIAGASIADNLIYETPRINNGDELLSAIITDCFDGETMLCAKGKLLTLLDTTLNIGEEKGRSFERKNIDKIIYNRISKILKTNEFQMQLPKTIFQNAIVSYRSDRGLDINFPVEDSEGRGHLLKKKLLLPILLLLKLKFKALLPIFVAIIGLKATKALILSKLAITIILGYAIYQLVIKTGLLGGGMPMTMSPMTPDPSITAYGPPSTSAPPASSYDPSSWEPSSGGGPYSRIWEPPSGSHNLAYSSYYPHSYSSGSSSGSSGSSGSSSSSSSGSSSLTPSAY